MITGSETMGRFGNGLGAEFSEFYILEYWRDRLDKWVRYRNIENSEVMEGNSNTYLAVKQSIGENINLNINMKPLLNINIILCLNSNMIHVSS